jgi:UDP-N-acetylmuramate dehydrogenase
VAFGEPLSRYTSLQVGGPADAIARPATREALRDLLEWCHARGVPVLVLGSGFNTLVRDGGFRGVVVRLHSLRSIERVGDTAVRAEAGATHTRVTRFCAEAGLAGLEFAVGIPGTVGGWLAMNAGIGVCEMKDVVDRVEWIDTGSGELRSVPARDLRFRYRGLELPQGAVLIAARFALRPDEPREIRARMQQLLAQRRRTQPVDQPSFGSVFKNPPGDFAGRLVEAAGLKGAREGDAEISTLHANFIVNRGRATASDALKLMERARDEVARRFGVELEREVRVVGVDS